MGRFHHHREELLLRGRLEADEVIEQVTALQEVLQVALTRATLDQRERAQGVPAIHDALHLCNGNIERRGEADQVLPDGGVVRLAQEAAERGDALLLLDKVEHALLRFRQAEACAQQGDAGVRGRDAVGRDECGDEALGERHEALDQVLAHARAGQIRQQRVFGRALHRAIGVEEGLAVEDLVPRVARLRAAVPARPELRKLYRIDEREAQRPELTQEVIIMQTPVQMRATRHHLQCVARRPPRNRAHTREVLAPRPARDRFRLFICCFHLQPPGLVTGCIGASGGDTS